jgi:glycosyltransferase involved in cell wall biosynthesis
VLQDLISFVIIDRILTEINLSGYDIYFNYNGMFCGSEIARYAKRNGIPVIYDIADDLPEMIASSPQIPSLLKSVGKVVGKKTLQRNVTLADKVTITTRYLQSAYKIPSEKTELIPNGVDIQLFRKKDSAELRKKLKLDTSFVIGHVGVLREWLNFHPLFSAVKKLAPLYDIKILMVGGGVGYEDTVKLAKSYNIADNIFFSGTIPYHQIPDYIGCMDICVIPFKEDSVSQNSLPLKLFEYMACEKPVICTNVRAIREIFYENLLFVSGSQGYEDAILRLFKDENLRKQLGFNGRTIIEDHYQWGRLSKRLENIMIELCERT